IDKRPITAYLIQANIYNMFYKTIDISTYVNSFYFFRNNYFHFFWFYIFLFHCINLFVFCFTSSTRSCSFIISCLSFSFSLILFTLSARIFLYFLSDILINQGQFLEGILLHG